MVHWRVVRWTILAMVLVLAGCDVAVLTYDGSDQAAIDNAVVTADGTDGYTIAGTNGKVDAAPLDSNTGQNLREVFWPADSPVVANGQTCAEWDTQGGNDVTQQGAALQIVSADGVTRALTVTKNVYFGATWIFNFHAWDSSRTPSFALFSHFDLHDVFAPNDIAVPLPWHLCARVIRGRLDFEAWPDSEPQPPWSSTTHGGSAPIPDGWGQPGMTGWYIGHLPPGGSAALTGLTTWKIVDSSTTSTQPATTTTQPATTTSEPATTTTQPATTTTQPATTTSEPATTTTQPTTTTTSQP